MFPRRSCNARLRARGVRGALPPGRGFGEAFGPPREGKQGGLGARRPPNGHEPEDFTLASTFILLLRGTPKRNEKRPYERRFFIKCNEADCPSHPFRNARSLNKSQNSNPLQKVQIIRGVRQYGLPPNSSWQSPRGS